MTAFVGVENLANVNILLLAWMGLPGVPILITPCRESHLKAVSLLSF